MSTKIAFEYWRVGKMLSDQGLIISCAADVSAGRNEG